MRKRINYIVGIVSYIISFLLIIYYLILELSLFKITSPVLRLIIILFIIICMHIGASFLIKEDDKFNKMGKINLWIWFLLYIIMVLNLTLFDKYFGREGVSLYLNSNVDIKDIFNDSFNIIPFATINNYFLALKNGNLTNTIFIYNIFGNLVAFMPLAFFLPRIFRNIDKWYKYFIVVSVFIIFIEISQYVMMTGSFDIDDYILNILGAMIIYIFINNQKISEGIDKFLYLNNE